MTTGPHPPRPPYNYPPPPPPPPPPSVPKNRPVWLFVLIGVLALAIGIAGTLLAVRLLQASPAGSPSPVPATSAPSAETAPSAAASTPAETKAAIPAGSAAAKAQDYASSQGFVCVQEENLNLISVACAEPTTSVLFYFAGKPDGVLQHVSATGFFADLGPKFAKQWPGLLKLALGEKGVATVTKMAADAEEYAPSTAKVEGFDVVVDSDRGIIAKKSGWTEMPPASSGFDQAMLHKVLGNDHRCTEEVGDQNLLWVCEQTGESNVATAASASYVVVWASPCVEEAICTDYMRDSIKVIGAAGKPHLRPALDALVPGQVRFVGPVMLHRAAGKMFNEHEEQDVWWAKLTAGTACWAAERDC